MFLFVFFVFTLLQYNSHNYYFILIYERPLVLLLSMASPGFGARGGNNNLRVTHKNIINNDKATGCIFACEV